MHGPIMESYSEYDWDDVIPDHDDVGVIVRPVHSDHDQQYKRVIIRDRMILTVHLNTHNEMYPYVGVVIHEYVPNTTDVGTSVPGFLGT